jgi:hypothetical protein
MRSVSSFVTVVGMVVVTTMVGSTVQRGSAESNAQQLTACTLLTDQEIKKAAGARIEPYLKTLKADETPLPRGSECSKLRLQIQLDVVPPSQFEQTQKIYASRTTSERVPDVGDGAHSMVQGTPGAAGHAVAVLARSGGHVFVLTMSVRKNETADEIRSIVIALAKIAAAKLK